MTSKKKQQSKSIKNPLLYWVIASLIVGAMLGYEFAKNPDYKVVTYPKEGEVEDRKEGRLRDAGKQIPFVDKLTIFVYRESQPMWLNFMRGNIDSAAIPKDSYDSAIDEQQNLKKELDDIVASKDLDQDFHRALARATGNSVLLQVVELLDHIFLKSRHAYSQSPQRNRLSLKGHQEILKAVINKDSRTARKLMTGHLNAIRELVIPSNHHKQA